jgi:hypothetical protein
LCEAINDVLYVSDWRGSHRRRPWKGLIFLAGTVLITEGAVGLTCAVLKLDKHILENQWMKILGFSRFGFCSSSLKLVTYIVHDLDKCEWVLDQEMGTKAEDGVSQWAQ